MSNIWFVSDTHFFHANAYKFLRDDGVTRMRHEFHSAEKADSFMLDTWNKYVKPGDKVYHLGDVTFRYDGLWAAFASRLHGHKRLIVGNHDNLMSHQLLRYFEKVDLWTGGKFKHKGFVATHIPLRDDQMRGSEFNVHGHIHHHNLRSPRHVCVCVEQTGYRPVNIDELPGLLKEQQNG
jgi:calcineurin-like phosphoesterase family protein